LVAKNGYLTIQPDSSLMRHFANTMQVKLLEQFSTYTPTCIVSGTMIQLALRLSIHSVSYGRRKPLHIGYEIEVRPSPLSYY